MTPKIVSVEAAADCRLIVGFASGEQKSFDVAPYLDKGFFSELRDPEYFSQVRLCYGGVEWPHEQDLSTDTLYLRGNSFD